MLLAILLLLPPMLLSMMFALDDAGVREILRAVVGVAGSPRAEEAARLGVEGTDDDVPDTSGGVGQMMERGKYGIPIVVNQH